MSNAPRAFLALLLISVVLVPGCVLAQVSVTQSTAGIDPNIQNPTFPAGLNGLSTGSTAQFTALGTAPTPNIPRPANTLTGEALSAFEASIATNAAQASGSDFMYTSTTGNQISGVAATLSGGYNEQAPGQSSMASVSSSTQSTSSNDGGFTMRVLGSERQSLLAGVSLLLTAFLFGVGHVF